MSKVPKRSNNIDRGKLEKKGSTVKGSASKKKPIDQSLSDSVFALSKNKEPPVPISTLPDNEKAWILGRSYDLVCSTNLHHHSLWLIHKHLTLSNVFVEKEHAAFSQRAMSFFRFTYRRDFPALHPYPITSDAGWGCMLRSAQMLMGYALLRQQLGADWRMPMSSSPQQRLKSLQKCDAYCNILRYFLDQPGKPHVYSLHHLVQAGMRYDKLPGEWFGPSTVSLVLRDLCKAHQHRLQGKLSVLVSSGDVVYVDEAEQLCSDTRLNSCLLGYAYLDEATAVESAAMDNAATAVESTTARTTSRHSGLRGEVSSAEAAQKMSQVARENLQRMSVRSQLHQSHNSQNRRSRSRQHSASESNSGLKAEPEEETGVEGDLDPLAQPSAQLRSQRVSDDPLGMMNNSSSNNHADGDDNLKDTDKDDTFFDPLLRPPPSYQLPWTQSLLLLVPLRLGTSAVDPQLAEELLSTLRHPACVGILGGRPNHAIYFVGHGPQGRDLYGLDPHTTFSALDEQLDAACFPGPDFVDQLHVPRFVTLPIQQLDVSLALGFFFADRAAFQDFCTETTKHTQQRLSQQLPVLFQILPTKPAYLDDKGLEDLLAEDEDEEEEDEEEEEVSGAEKEAEGGGGEVSKGSRGGSSGTSSHSNQSAEADTDVNSTPLAKTNRATAATTATPTSSSKKRRKKKQSSTEHHARMQMLLGDISSSSDPRASSADRDDDRDDDYVFL